MNYEEVLNNIYELVKKHSNLFSINAFDISILPGWIPMVEELLTHIQNNLKENERLWIVQIKEKLGQLRIIFGTSGISNDRSGIFKDLIKNAEHKSKKTCVFCGENGHPFSKGWVSPRCEEHLSSEFEFADKSISILAKHEDRMAELLGQN